MKKIISMLLVLAMMLSLAACGASKAPAAPEAPAADAPVAEAPAAEEAIKPITLKIYSPGNENSVPTKTIIEYARLVNEASNGAITLDVHHSNELGNDAEAIESTRMGTIDIIFAGTSGFTAFYEKAKILDLPFLFNSAEQAYEVTNGEVGEKIFADFEQFGLVYLSEGDNGMRHISTTNRPIHTAEAQDNATYHLVANATYDDIKYFSNINYMWMGCTMAVNAATWNKLDPQVQAILKEQAKAAAKYSFDTIAADNETATKVLQEAGVEFNFEPDVKSFQDMLGGDAYYDRYENETWFDRDLLNAILEVVR